MIISLAEAKEYLRVDSDFEDAVIEQLIKSAEKICADVARLKVEEYEEKGDLAKIAVLYTLGYLYENRTDADYNKMMSVLRALLFAIREGVEPP